MDAQDAKQNTPFTGLVTQHQDQKPKTTTPRRTDVSKYTRLPTPVKPDKLLQLLKTCNYNTQLTEYLVNGFRYGFKIGNDAPTKDIHANNTKNVNTHKDIVQSKLQVELDAGRIMGPFKHPPYHPFQISPLNIREKKTPGKYRLIQNLSYPYDSDSINYNIPQTLKTVKYASVLDAIKILTQLPRGAYTAKTDIADAFRLIPVHPSDYPKLGIQLDGYYYFDRVLPQGCGSSCRIFETFSTALQAIFEHIAPDAKCVHMIDDFFIMATDAATCQRHLDTFINLCSEIGVPIAPHKTTQPSNNTAFLGIELDTLKHLAKLPPDKLSTYSQDVQEALSHKKITRSSLESLVGKLSFAASVVPARPFLRRLINNIHTVEKPHYYIRITKPMQADLITWQTFLQSYNGITYFRTLNIVESTAINMVSDASKQGFGACYGKQWIQSTYPLQWQQYHITVLELYPIYVMINMFGHLLKNSTIIFHCDNEAVTNIINKLTSKDNNIMAIIRPLVLQLIHHNIHLRSKHIPGIFNVLPDRISRFQVTPQLLISHGMNLQPTHIPTHLKPDHFSFS